MPLLPKRTREHQTRYGGWLDLALQAALTLALAVTAFTLGGRWLDSQLNSDPWFMIFGALWGAVGGTVWVVLKVKQYGDAQEREEQKGE